MIYSFEVKIEDKEPKQFYLTADNQRQLYNKIFETYKVQKENVTILAEYNETGVDSYELHKKYVDDSNNVINEDVIKKAKEIIANKKYRSNASKDEYIKKHNFECVDIKNEKDLYPLIEKYKIVKVYFEKGEKRGSHKHYAVYK